MRRALPCCLLIATVTGCGGDEARSRASGGGGSDAAPDADAAPPVDAGADRARDVEPPVDVVDAPSEDARAPGPALRTGGRFFIDDAGGVVILRGVNVAGNSKVPPFLPLVGDAELDRLRDWGFNVIRLVFTWEAYEPQPGSYDDAYLAALTAVAEGAWQRGIRTIVDFHQDGFSRFVSSGCGDGFPEWALPAGTSKDTPDNSDSCHDWAIKMSLDPDMHGAFGAFYGDDEGVRTRYLELWDRLAGNFASVDGVIGYDLLNEPWGFEQSEIGPLYEDTVPVIRAKHPSAILFIEGHVSTNNGVIQTMLAKPSFGNFAYSPHFYESLALTSNSWSGIPTATDIGFNTMDSKAAEWDVPLFVGEFGIGATATNGLAYVDLQYERLNDRLASAAYWNFTPGWTATSLDGWNGEDLSLVDDQGLPRATFRYRPYPRRVAGVPTAITVTHGAAPSETTIDFTWDHDPVRGSTELFVPRDTLYGAGGGSITTAGANLSCSFAGDVVRCSSPDAGGARVTVGP